MPGQNLDVSYSGLSAPKVVDQIAAKEQSLEVV